MKPNLHPRFQKWFSEQAPDVQKAIRDKHTEFGLDEEYAQVAAQRYQLWFAKQPEEIQKGESDEAKAKISKAKADALDRQNYAVDTMTMMWCANIYGYKYGP